LSCTVAAPAASPRSTMATTCASRKLNIGRPHQVGGRSDGSTAMITFRMPILGCPRSASSDRNGGPYGVAGGSNTLKETSVTAITTPPQDKRAASKRRKAESTPAPQEEPALTPQKAPWWGPAVLNHKFMTAVAGLIGTLVTALITAVVYIDHNDPGPTPTPPPRRYLLRVRTGGPPSRALRNRQPAHPRGTRRLGSR
jgi:hypothetical protein